MVKYSLLVNNNMTEHGNVCIFQNNKFYCVCVTFKHSNLISLLKVFLESLLRPIYEKMERAGEDQMQVVRVGRHIWKDALRALSKAHFLAGVLLSVHFIGEQAADMGGPEFLRLLMRSLANESGVLAGSDRRKVFSSSPLLVTQRAYFHAGRMVATSLLQGGPGPKCFSPAVYAYLLGEIDKCRRLVTVEDIPDEEPRKTVTKVLTKRRRYLV